MTPGPVAWQASHVFSRRKRLRLPRIDQVNQNELDWVASQLEAASVIAASYGVQAAEGPASMDELSAAAQAWLTDDDSRIEVNTLVNALGIATGEHIRQRCNLTWVIATDGAGSDLALYGEPGEVLIYPANAVSKRIVDGDADLSRFANALVSEVLAIGDR
jgi:hypothetical protein